MSSTTNSSFDPYTQSITIYMADGVTPVAIRLSDIDGANSYGIMCAINYGCQMGACLVMFFVILVLTRDTKRRTAIFILNSLSLVFGFLRALLPALYFASPWYRVYAQATGDFSSVPRSAYATSVAGTIFPFLMMLTVNTSLVMQAYTVCKNMRSVCRYPIIALAHLVLLAAVGFRFAEMVTNSMAIMWAGSFYSKMWIQTGTLVTETTSIWFFSIIFTGKLAWTLVTRKVMGWRQWSGVRILAAMGGCTMIIPSIFASLQYVSFPSFPQAGSLALTMVALLLPLSSLWAGMAIDHETSTLDLAHLTGSNSTRNCPDPSHGSHGSLTNQFGSLTTNPSALGSSTARKGSMCQISPTSMDSGRGCIRPLPRDSTELDLEAMGVRVDRSYEVYEVRNEE